MSTTIATLKTTLLATLPFSYLPKHPRPHPEGLTMDTQSLKSLLATIIATKEQLCFYATLLRRHSPPFLFFLENYEGAPHFKHWKTFNPYRRHCLRIILSVFEDAIEEVERDEDVVAEWERGFLSRFKWAVPAKEVADVLLRWSIGIKNRRLGRLILDSWKQEVNAAGVPEGSGSCDIKDVVHLMAAVWEEEKEKECYHYPNSSSEDMSSNGGGGGEGWTGAYEVEDSEEVEEEFEAWRPFKGPPCLKRKDALHLVYRD
ncbi:hypothetical protein TWF481_003753 [Arthrobotrys musiformis]|uniref:Uncharacterized protein n=1 Tax=Arthrobotrys musiformis TaxID=47236 RepID=A0AAV9WJ32_9PEZI